MLDLRWSVSCLRTVIVTTQEVADKLQFSASNMSEADPGATLLIKPHHNTSNVDPRLHARKLE